MTDKVYDKKHQHYAEDNGAALNCTQWENLKPKQQ